MNIKDLLCLSVLLTVAVSSSLAQSGGINTLDNGLIAYYPFAGSANDASGNGNNGVVNGAIPTNGLLGTQNTAYLFQGADNITIPDNPSLSLNQLTVTCWVNLQSWSQYANIVGKDGDQRQYCLQMDSGGQFRGGIFTSTGEYVIDSADIVSVGTWHQLIQTWDGQTESLYLDGALEAAIPTTGTLLSGNDPLYIGQLDGSKTLNGLISEVRIYNRALSSNEVSALYAMLPGISYTTNGSTLTLASYTLGGTAVIPASTNGLPVTAIGNGAFQYNINLISAVLPSGVTNIGSYAFAGCSSVTNITIPSTVTTIGDDAFEGCVSLTNLVIPSGVTSIGQNAFSGCSNLASITLPNSIISIGQNAFSNCPSLATVTASDDLMRYLSQNESFIGLNQQAVSSFTAPTFGSWIQKLIVDLTGNQSFIQAVANQIVKGTNNYGIAVKQNQTLMFPAINPISYSSKESKITLSANSSPGIAPVNFTSANAAVATISGNTLTVAGAGSTTITAMQNGNALWNPVMASQPFVVIPITQTLSFHAIPIQQSVGGQQVIMNASSSAKLSPIDYSVANTAIASVSNNILTILGVGTTTVTASQAGTQNYTPATATQTLIVK